MLRQANSLLLALLVLALLSACASNPSTAPVTSRRPVSPVTPTVVDVTAPVTPPTPTITWADQVVMPGIYRAYLVNGRMVMQRETDPKVITAPPSSMRFVMGNPERGEIMYQPMMLEQEHATELARTREQQARNEQIFTVMVEKVTNLEKATAAERRATAALMEQMKTQATYIKELEAKIAEAEAQKAKK